MSADETNRLNELVRTFARREADLVLKNAQNAFTGEMASRLIDTVNAMSSQVGAMDKKLGVVSFQVDNLEHTLLGNSQPGKCQKHSDAISALRDFMSGLKAQFRVLTWVSAAAISVTGLALTAGIFFYGTVKKTTGDIDTFHAAAQVEATRSAAKQAAMQDSLDAEVQRSDAAKTQRDEIQKTQADGATVIYREYKKMRPPK